MAEFSATDAALEGFRLTRERPKAVLIWAAVYLLGFVAILTLVFGTLGAAFFNVTNRGDPEEAARAMARLAPAVLLVLPILLLMSAVLVSAIYRAILKPEQSRRGYLRLGGDELRILLLTLVLGIGFALAALVLILVVGALYEVAAPLGVLAGVGAVGLSIWGAVRLSLAAPMTFNNQKLEIAGAWRLTKGRFWPLLGAYVLAIILSILISMLAAVISLALLATFGGGIAALAQANRPDFSEFGAGLAVGFALYALVQIAAALLQLVIQTAPAAAAYRDIAGVGPSDTAEVFS